MDRKLSEALDRWITRSDDEVRGEEGEENSHSGIFVYGVYVGKEEVFVSKGDYPFDTMMEAEAYIGEILDHVKIDRKEFKIIKSEM